MSFDYMVDVCYAKEIKGELTKKEHAWLKKQYKRHSLFVFVDNPLTIGEYNRLMDIQYYVNLVNQTIPPLPPPKITEKPKPLTEILLDLQLERRRREEN